MNIGLSKAMQHLADADWLVYVNAITCAYVLIDPAGVESTTNEVGLIAAAQNLPPCRLTYDEAVSLAARALERDIQLYKSTCPAHRSSLGIDCRKVRAAMDILRRFGQADMFEELV